MVYSQAWKNLERFTAKALQGFRIPRGANFSRSLPDVVADASKHLARCNGIIYAECKYSINNPWVEQIESLYDNKLLIINRGSNGKLVLFELRDIGLLSSYNLKRPELIKKTVPKYINSHLEQSKNYIDSIRKDPITRASIQAITNLDPYLPVLPIVVLGQKGKAFRLCYTSSDCILNFILQNDKGFGVI